MKVKHAFLTVVGAVVLTGSVWAQHNHNAAAKPAVSSPEETSAACQHHMMEAKDTLAKLDAAVMDAQQAESVEGKQKALAEVSSLVDQLKQHLNMCPMMQADSMQHMENMNCMGKKAKDQKAE